VYVHFFDNNGKRLNGSGHLIGLGGHEQEWRDFSVTFISPARAEVARIWIHSYGAATVTAYLDDLEIRPLATRKDGVSARAVEDMAVIKERLRREALAGHVNVPRVRAWIRSQREDGGWDDIDYKDRDRTAWAPARHVDRIWRMSQAFYAEGSPLRNDAALKRAILSAFDFWTRKKLRCPNWWYNVIGVPRILYRAMLLLEPDLSPERMEAGIRILKDARLGMTGQNLVWVAEVNIARGCLQKDPWLVRLAFSRIAAEIRITTAEGIQPDYSFYQHGTQFYSGGYGRGFSHDCARFAALAHGTCFQFPPEKIRILSAYILDGQQWMIRDGTFDYSACGRELSRKGGGNARALIGAVRYLLALPPEELPRKSEFEALLERLESFSPEKALSGNRCFWRVDYMAHHRPAFMASVRMTSPRVVQTETCNSENLLGGHLSDGVFFLYRRGDEYRGIFPVWDWKRLPGITVALTPAPPVTRNGRRGERDFVGGVSDGTYGLAVMDFARAKLTAQKAWCFLDREVVCFGQRIAYPGRESVITVVNQCLQRGPVYVSGSGAPAASRRIGTEEVRLTGPAWVWHDEVLYLFPGATRVVVRAGPQTGNWHRINHVYDATPVTMDVFMLWIEHGTGPADAAYSYRVVPGVPFQKIGSVLAADDAPVVRGRKDGKAQVVLARREGVSGVVFWARDAVDVDTGLGFRLSADAPCTVLLHRTDAGRFVLAVADPSQKRVRVSLQFDRIVRGEGGVEAPGGRSRVEIDLPQGGEAGKSVMLNLRLGVDAPAGAASGKNAPR